MKDYLKDMFKGYGIAAWIILKPLLSLGALIVALCVSSPWLYVPILAVLFLPLAYESFQDGIKGRSSEKHYMSRILNVTGTSLYFLLSAFFATVFVGILIWKVNMS